MDFDSPDVAKEFPGLYMGDAGKTLNDPSDFEDDERGKKKKEKKKSEKEKGYATLAGESSHDEDELDPKSPGKAKKIFKLSAKKKDKKSSIDKPDKDRSSAEKEKDKSKKSDKDKKLTAGETEEKKAAAAEKIGGDKLKDKKVGKEEKDKKSSDKDKKKEEKKKKLSRDDGRVSAAGTSSPSIATATETKEKEKEKGLNLNLALNAFLNAPAPLLLKKEKEKKEKDGSSKVKLKLKRSKNSLEDSQSSQSDISFTVTHQFPEDPEAILKEIRKYEALLEQTHTQMKSSKKISKKSEEQLWELQRTLTQLKRKLRSINALSVSSPATVPSYPQAEAPAKKSEPVSLPVKEDSVRQEASVDKPDGHAVPSAGAAADEEIKFDFTLKTPSSPPRNSTVLPPPPAAQNTETCSPNPALIQNSGTMSPLKQEVDMNPQQPPTVENNNLSPYVVSDAGSSNSNLASSITPEAEVQRVQVEVQVHHRSSAQQTQSPLNKDTGERIDTTTTPEVKVSSAVIKSLTFSDEEIDDDAEDDVEEVTDVSSLSLRNTNAENENSFLDDGVDLKDGRIQDHVIPTAEVDPFEMSVFETEEYLAIENEALIFFNEELQEQIQKEEAEIDELMKQLEQMSLNGVDIDAPEIDLDLDQFEFDELVSLWQITKLENEALNEQVNHLRQMVAISKLEEFRLETRLKYLEEKTQSGRNCALVPTTVDNENYTE